MLETIDLKKKISKAVYRARLEELQGKLREQQYAANVVGQAIIICLEGWEMSGKGELIKKLTAKLKLTVTTGSGAVTTVNKTVRLK